MPNQKRQRLPIPWGAGIDRASGAMAVESTSFSDLRNVRLGRGRVELRKGFARQTELPGGDMVVGIFPIRAQGLSAALGYSSVDRTVSLYVTDATGTAIAFIGTLWTLPVDVPSPPSVVGAASYDKLVIAHDEAQYKFRQQTMVYAPLEGTITPLMADFAREGTEYPVKFRGVASYLAYIVGWGYGQHNTDPAVENEDRPETARISDPGQPTVFQPEHYFLVGQQGDPIIGGSVVGRTFAFMKSAESYQLFGTDRTTFGIQSLDPQRGLLASKLKVSVGPALYAWDSNGPWTSEGNGATDLAEPLWLVGPVPDPTATATPNERAFAYYDRVESEVHFVFGAWVYVLHLNGENPRWSYRKLGVPLLCAGVIWIGGTSAFTPPEGVTPGVASYIDPSYTPGDADPKFYVPWTWTAAAPGQRAEVWAKLSTGGTWAQYANVPASNGFVVIKVPDGPFLSDYDIQIRFTQFGIPAPGYEDPDPSMWPVGSLVTVSAGGTPAFFGAGRFIRFSGSEVGFYGGIARLPGVAQGAPAAYTYEIEYSSPDDLGPWTALTLAATPPWNELRLPNSLTNATVFFRIRAVLGAVNGPWLEIPLLVVQPEPPAAVAVSGSNNPGGPNDDTDGHTITWSPPALLPGPVAPADGPYDVRGRHYDTLAFIGPWSAIDPVGFGVHAHTMNIPGVDPSTTGSRTCQVQVRVNQGSGDVSIWVDALTFEP